MDLPPDFVLSVPNSLLKVLKLSCVQYHMVSSRSVSEPITQRAPMAYSDLVPGMNKFNPFLSVGTTSGICCLTPTSS